MFDSLLIPVVVGGVIAAIAIVGITLRNLSRPEKTIAPDESDDTTNPTLSSQSLTPQSFPTPQQRSSGSSPARMGRAGLNWYSGSGSGSGTDKDLLVTGLVGAQDVIAAAATEHTVSIVNVNSAGVTPVQVTEPDSETTRLEIPGINSEFKADEEAPTVGDLVTFTDASTTNTDSPDIWLWDLDDGDESLEQNPTKTYLLPGLKSIHLAAFKEGSDIPTIAECKDDYLTVAGIFDTYGTAFILFAPVLLQRLNSNDFGRIREDSGNTTAEIGFTLSEVDESEITSHVGANNGYWERVYMHDSSARYLNQTTQANQPQSVDSGTIIKDALIMALRFNGTTQFMAMTDYAYWGGDRSKIFVWLVIRPTSTTSLSNYMINHWAAGSNQRSWSTFHDGQNNQFGFNWSAAGTSTFQTNVFDSLTAGELCVVTAQLDTALAAASRVVALKNGSALTYNGGASSGNVSGNVLDSSAPITLGAINTTTTPGGHYEGDILAGAAIAANVSTSDRDAIIAWSMAKFNIT